MAVTNSTDTKINKMKSFIGGTIAVPFSTTGMMDPMDISCRSDLTQDLVPDDSGSLLGTSMSTRASTVHPHRYAREYTRKNSSERQLQQTGMLKRNISCSSFHTATNLRNSDLRTDEDDADADKEDMDQLEFPALEVDDDDNSEMRELDEQAERAAIAAFGSDASQRVDGGPLRRSTLVAENATIDVSWFAARGLMSRRSFERYQEEMKSKVISSASNGNLRAHGRRSRRASISMSDLRNQEWPTAVEKPKKSSRRGPSRRASVAYSSTPAPLQQIAVKVPPKPRSLDGLDEYGDLAEPFSHERHQKWPTVEKPQKARRRVPTRRASVAYSSTPAPPQHIAIKIPPKPRSLDGLDQFGDDLLEPCNEGLDELVKSFIIAFKKGDAEQGGSNKETTASLLKSRLMGDTVLKSSFNSDSGKKSHKRSEVNDNTASSGLNSEEIEVLTKMMKRLSQEQDDSPFQNEVEEECSIQDELMLNGMKRDCSGDDLMDSSQWETKPSHKMDREGSTEASSIENARPKMFQRRSSSIRSLNTLKAGNESDAGRLPSKYVPKRTTSVELKNIKLSSSLASYSNEDSFITAQVERNDTLSSSDNILFSKPSGRKEERGDSISSMLSPVQDPRSNSEGTNAISERSDTVSTIGFDLLHELSDTISTMGFDTFGSLSPQKKAFERSDTLSTKSPPQEEGRDENHLPNSTSDKLDMPVLDRGLSTASVTTTGAVTKEVKQSKLDRGVSLASVTSNCAVTSAGPSLDDSLSTIGTFNLANKAPRPPRRATVKDTKKTAGCIHDELDRFDKLDSEEVSFGANRFPPNKNSRPPRCNSTSSLSTSGSSLMLRRNSFSSLLTPPIDLDELDGPPLKEMCGDILQEGIEYLSMAMLVNVYAKLRELSMLGHASVKFQDIDVNSHQALVRKKEMRRLGLLKTENEPYLDSTKTAGAIVRTVLDEYEMFKASSELPSGFTNKASMTYDETLLSQFKDWVEESRVKQLDNVTEQVIKSLREECMKRQLMVKERVSNDSLSTMEQASVRRSIARRRGSLIEKSNSFEESAFLKQERTLIADHFGLNSGSIPKSSRGCDASDDSRRIANNGALTESMIDKTLEKAHCYFQEGSSMRNLLESGLEVVWFADRHPDDIIYCICVNRETSTVTVVFRGQEGFFDLIQDSAFTRYSNPNANEDYEGNSEFIDLRSAVSDEMMRVRRDTKQSTLDEIRQKVDEIGKELTDDGRYHLSVCGHSKGGGLATVAGFYLASDPSLELASAVRVFTFSSSRVGCKAFQQSFKHLEETGRLQYARFTNSGDIVSIFPKWDAYHHVGMQIRLHKANSAGRQRISQALDVNYNSSGSRIEEAFYFVVNFFSAMQASRISEYQHRMHFAREYRLALGEGVLRFDKKRHHLKSLNDYYLMKCRLSDIMGLGKENATSRSFLVFFLVSCLISFEVALLFKFVATW